MRSFIPWPKVLLSPTQATFTGSDLFSANKADDWDTKHAAINEVICLKVILLSGYTVRWLRTTVCRNGYDSLYTFLSFCVYHIYIECTVWLYNTQWNLIRKYNDFIFC